METEAAQSLPVCGRGAGGQSQQFGVDATGGRQFGRGADLPDMPAVEGDDRVHRGDGRQAVGDDQRGASHHQFLQTRLDCLLGAGVEGRGRLVEDEDGGVLQHRAGDGDALLLPAGQPEATLADDRVVAVAEPADEDVGVGASGDVEDLLLGGVGASVGDVLADGAGEQRRLLEDHADHAAQLRGGEVLAVMTVDTQGTGGRPVQPEQQVDEGGLSATGLADQCDLLVVVGGERHLVDDLILRGVRIVAERHLVEVDDRGVR